MSLCIAAACRLNFGSRGPCIVHCYDTAGTRGDVKSEDVNKLRIVGSSVVLLAGNMSEARQLLATCRPVIDPFVTGGDELAMTRLLNDLRGCVRERKRAISTGALSAEFGLSYDEVFNWSQSHPNDPPWTEAWDRIRSLNFGAELIITTFTDDEAAILTIESHGRVAWQEHYAAIGTGAGIATAFLHQRDYGDYMDLSECIYRLIEAKTAAEKNPHVGVDTRILICAKDRTYMLHPSYKEEEVKRVKRIRDASPWVPLTTDQILVSDFTPVSELLKESAENQPEVQ